MAVWSRVVIVLVVYAVVFLLMCSFCSATWFMASQTVGFPFEGRGIWVWATSFSSNPVEGPRQIQEAFKNFSELNFNIVFFLVKGSEGWLYYNSSIGPVDTRYAWDPLKVAVNEANSFGLELHAWLCVFRDIYLARTNTSLASVHINSNVSTEWVCPSSKAVRDYEKGVILEVARNYDVDGIHLDYIRYENRSYCYCPRCRAEFKSIYGFDPKENSNSEEWVDWRAQQIETFIYEVKTAVEAIKPGLQVSAAVYVNLQDAATNRFQNWKAWADKHFISFIVPMAYTNDTKLFESWVRNITGIIRQKVPILIGIGLYKIAEHPLNSSDVLREQINITRQLGAQGWVLFRYNYLYEDLVSAIPPPITDQTPPSICEPIQNPLRDNVYTGQNVTVAVVVCDAGSGVRDVILSYSIDNGVTWTNITMIKIDEKVYVGQIPSFAECNDIYYKIIAHDNFGNQAINDNAGQFWTYHIIPETNGWQSLLLIFIMLSIAITLLKNAGRRHSPS